MDTNDNDLDLLEEYDEIEEEDDKDDKILQIPMDDFAGDIDLSEMNINLRHNLEQARKRRQESRQKLYRVNL